MPVLANPRHEAFAQARAQGKTIDQAYVVAGYKANDGNATRLNGNERILSRIEEIVTQASERAGVTVERIIAEMAKIGFSDIRKLVSWRGNVTQSGEDPDTGEPTLRSFNEVALVDSDKLDGGMAAAISEVSQSKDGSLRIKLHSKLDALTKLGQNLGMFKDTVKMTGADGGPVRFIIEG